MVPTRSKTTPSAFFLIAAAGFFFASSPAYGQSGELEVMPDFYKEPGISPNRDYVNQHYSEYIDPFSGALKLHHVDIRLPGNGGFDLKVERSYSSNSINWLNPFYRTSLAGLGWTVHFGRVIKGSTTGICVDQYPTVKGNPVLELPDGSQQLLTFTGGSPLMITAQRWRADCKSGGTGLIVYSPDGTQYDMSQPVVELGEHSWYAKKITDRNGNYATVTYANSQSPQITGVTTSDGRSLSFTYAGSGTTSHRITSVTGAPGQTYYYEYRAIPGVLGGYYLSGVRRPDGTSWGYTYNDQLPDYQAGSYHLKRVTYPEGGTVSYGYDYVYFDRQNINSAGRSVVVSDKSSNPGGNWTFAYSPGAQGQHDSTTVTSPSGTTTYRHVGPNYSASGTVWMVGLLMSKTIGSAQTETYSWDKQQLSGETNFRSGLFVTKFDNAVYAPIMTDKSVSRSGATHTTAYSQFDSYGNPGRVAESGPNGGSRTTTLTYHIDASKWIVKQIKNESFSGSSISRAFDASGNLTSLTRNGVTTGYAYDGEGNISSITFPRGLRHAYWSYHRGIPQNESQPEGINIARTVSDAGNVEWERNGEGNATRYSYDGLNRLTSIDPPIGNSTTIAYGPTTKQSSRGSLTETVVYDGFGRPASITLGGIAHTYRYDALGRRVFASNPDSASGTGYQYDILDRPIKITHPDNTSQTISYGAATKTVTNERSHATTYRYRAYGDPNQQFLMGINAPEPSASVSIARNSVDLVETVSQNGLTRTYGYNGNYYLTSVYDPEIGATAYGRDAAGNMTSRTVASAGTTSYTYDNQNRLYSADYPGNTPSTTNVYSRTNKLKSVSSSAATRSFDYDNNDNLTTETLIVDGYVFRAGYSYNANDQLSSITYPYSSRAVNYSPDVLGRPTQVSVYVTDVDYWPSGQIKQIVHGNGAISEYGQNARLWPSFFQASRSGTGFYVNSQYTYDGAGNLTQIGDATDASYRRTLGYDAINRLTDAAGPWGSGSIAYTGTGNIVSQVFGANRTDYTYDSQNRLTRIAGAQTASFGYDGYGDVISDSRYTYEYDGVPNLRCVSASAPCSGAASKIEYAYDGSNRRVSVTRAGVKAYEFHDSSGNLLMELTPGQGNRLVEYYYLGGKRVAQRVSAQPLLTVTKAGTGTGTVTSAPAGINCGATCSTPFAAGTGVTLTATPAAGSVFAGWGGACSGAGSCQVAMTDARSVTATFNLIPPAVLTVTRAGTGAGTVTSAPAGINCGPTCSATFPGGTGVTLTASPVAGSMFAGWGGACSGAGSCQVAMTDARSVTATFNLIPPSVLTVTRAGTGAGTVTSAPAGINCGPTCSAPFAAGTGVALTATPAAGSVFVGWGGACSGVGSCQVAMTDARSVTATFNPVTPIESIITHYYRAILGRAPDPGGLSYWQAEITRVQGLGIDAQEAFRVMAGQFFISPEYLGKNTGDAQYLTDLYATFFNRAPDSGGLSFWLGQIAAGMPRSNVLYGFLFSAEFGAYLQGLLGNTSSRQEVYAVVDFYRGLLGRLPDSGGFNYWLGRLRVAQCQGAAAVNAEVNTLSGLILSGAEYVGRQRSNRDFVADLFYTFMRRGSDLGSLNYWAGYLDSNPQNRDTVRWYFWQSAEYQGRVQQIVAQGCLQ